MIWRAAVTWTFQYAIHSNIFDIKLYLTVLSCVIKAGDLSVDRIPSFKHVCCPVAPPICHALRPCAGLQGVDISNIRINSSKSPFASVTAGVRAMLLLAVTPCSLYACVRVDVNVLHMIYITDELSCSLASSPECLTICCSGCPSRTHVHTVAL